MNLKCLRLEWWMIDYASYDQSITLPAHRTRSAERQYPYFKESYPRLGESNLKDGYYSMGKSCIFVYNKIKYKGEVDMFNFTLKDLNCFQKIGSTIWIDKLAAAEKQVYGKITTKTQELVYALELHRSQLNIKKGLVSFKKSLKRMKEK